MERLQERGEGGEGDHLDEFVAHAGAPAAAEGQEVLRLDQAPLWREEALGPERLWIRPQLRTHTQLVVVQEHQGVFLHSEPCTDENTHESSIPKSGQIIKQFSFVPFVRQKL